LSRQCVLSMVWNFSFGNISSNAEITNIHLISV
jgi:hypothetical protein